NRKCELGKTGKSRSFALTGQNLPPRLAATLRYLHLTTCGQLHFVLLPSPQVVSLLRGVTTMSLRRSAGTWFKSLRTRSHKKPRSRWNGHRLPFRLEQLEDRVTPASFVYNASSNPGIHDYTLRLNGAVYEVIETANPSNVLASQDAATTSDISIVGQNG